jgi:hypothetical protein
MTKNRNGNASRDNPATSHILALMRWRVKDSHP